MVNRNQSDNLIVVFLPGLGFEEPEGECNAYEINQKSIEQLQYYACNPYAELRNQAKARMSNWKNRGIKMLDDEEAVISKIITLQAMDTCSYSHLGLPKCLAYIDEHSFPNSPVHPSGSTIDHVVPGYTSASNLVEACHHCNTAKKARNAEQFKHHAKVLRREVYGLPGTPSWSTDGDPGDSRDRPGQPLRKSKRPCDEYLLLGFGLRG